MFDQNDQHIHYYFIFAHLDISDCAVIILTEPIEKHDRYVYEMGAEFLTHEQRAAIFSKVLSRTITYEQQSIETVYKMFIGFGMPHSYAYDLISLSIESFTFLYFGFSTGSVFKLS